MIHFIFYYSRHDIPGMEDPAELFEHEGVVLRAVVESETNNLSLQ